MDFPVTILRPNCPAIFSSSSYDAAASALFTQMGVVGTQPSDPQKTAISTLITSLKDAGVWTKFYGFWSTAAHEEAAAKLNWVSPASYGNLGLQGVPVFTANQGWTSTTAAYAQTPDNTDAWIAPWSTADAHMAVWSLTEGQEDAASMGSYFDNKNRIIVRSTGNTVDVGVNSSSLSGQVNTVGKSLIVAVRTAAAGGTVETYRNATSLGANTGNTASASSGSPMKLGSGNANGCTRQHCFFSVGSSLSAADVTNLYNALVTYFTAIGTPI